MKRIIVPFIFFCAFILGQLDAKAQCNQKLVYTCATNNGNAIYLKDFNAKLQKAKKNEPAPVAKFSVILNKGTHYRFTLCDPEGFEGRSVMYLYSANKLLYTTYNEAKDQDNRQFDYICKKTGTYYVFISFKKGQAEKRGCAVGVLSFVGKNKANE